MSTTNWSYHAVPVAFVTAGLPHWYSIWLSVTSKDMPKFANVSPRDFNDRVRRLEKQTPATQRYLRAQSAQQNGFENMPVFMATLVAGNAAGLGAATMNQYALTYIASRVAYNYLYVVVTTRKYSFLRTLAFWAGIIPTLGIWIKAGRLLV